LKLKTLENIVQFPYNLAQEILITLYERTHTHFGRSQVQLITYHSYATKVSQLKSCDFSGEAFKDFEVL